MESFRKSGLRNVEWDTTMENLSGVVFGCTNPAGGNQRTIREMTSSTAKKYRPKSYKLIRDYEYEYKVFHASPYSYSGRYTTDDDNINDALNQIATNVNRQNRNDYASYTIGCCTGHCSSRRYERRINVFCLIE